MLLFQLLLFNSRLPNIRARYETDLIRASNSFNKAMSNPWTGKGNPYTRKEVVERLHAQLKKGRPIIAAGTDTIYLNTPV